MSTTAQLLYSNYDHWGAKLDLYGIRGTEDEGCVITDVKRAGTTLNLTYLFSDRSLDEMSYWLDVEMHQQYLATMREAKAERIAYDALAARYDHQWGLL